MSDYFGKHRGSAEFGSLEMQTLQEFSAEMKKLTEAEMEEFRLGIQQATGWEITPRAGAPTN